ncbi:MAG: hypothetical protein J6X44_08500, partial [Thermoguttaceae bacterium]|nr:hypothetical protein [Thermoguttaceae bacterium]
MLTPKIVRFLFRSRKTSSDVPIRVFFLRMLAWCALLSLVFSIAVTLSFDKHEIDSDFCELAVARIKELESHASRSRKTSEALKLQAKKTAARMTTMVAEIISADPDILNVDVKESDEQKAGLGLLMKRLGLTEVSVVSEQGYVIASYPSDNLGVDFNQPPLNEFLRVLNSSEPVVQEIRANFNNPNDTTRRMYAGARRLDQPGVIQVGYEADPIESLFSLGGLENFVEPTLNKDHVFAVFNQDDELEAGDFSLVQVDMNSAEFEKPEHVKIDGKTWLLYAQRRDNLKYVCASSLNALIKSRSVVVALLIVANFFIFFAIFFLISYLIKKFIVESVYKINGSLEKITNGDLDERVDVTTSREFTDLSNGVNMTVDAL